MALLIFQRPLGPAQVFELHGKLDNPGAEKFDQQVTEALDSGHVHLLFDLAKLSFISSAGLTVFLKAYRRTQGVGWVRLAALQEDVRRVFDVTGLSARLEIYPTLDDALAGPLPQR